ncbi:MAG: hypothetical protein KAR44_11360 [Candidatus Aegiribacteria sp.]|nr:hypothetical protein [Candidatus Aegiribacteria sp.]
MKELMAFLLLVLFASSIHAAPGDILRSQTLSGQPSSGVRGLAMDWDTGLIWVAGPNGSSNIIYTTMDPVTMTTGTWLAAAADLGWIFDIGYGFDDGGTKYLLMNDQYSPFTKMIDPLDGSYDGQLPDYYSSGNYTNGCTVDWNTNNVYISSHGNPYVVYYYGVFYYPFTSITGAKNMGTAVGWDHLFILRTSSFYTIEVYEIGGAFIGSIPLAAWPSDNYVLGLSCGREDAVGENETLFFADLLTKQVHEIEVGDYTTPGSLTPSTWGEIKAGFVSTPDGNRSPSSSFLTSLK